MKAQGNRFLRMGIFMLALFVVWTVLIQIVDVRSAGKTGTEVGFAALNGWFHQLAGVHMLLYTMTDWLGLIPVFVCLLFGGLGFVQMIRRKCLLRVDRDILLLGVYYLLVIFVYLFFEMYPVNYRPILIEGRLEASYPSSTTLLVLSVMPTLSVQAYRRLQNVKLKKNYQQADAPVFLIHGCGTVGFGCSLVNRYCRFRSVELWIVLYVSGNRDIVLSGKCDGRFCRGIL